MIVTRFAPSPNGPLHLGHAFSAIAAHDRAKREDGEFLLRIEDIDGARSRPELADEFRADLAWLGLEYREVSPQSQRIANYRAAADDLRAMGLLYPCTCTRAEVAAAAHTHGPDGPLYPGTCLRRGPRPGADAAWRLDMEQAVMLAGPLEWADERRGAQKARPEMFGDVVLWRKDAPASYHLAATLDDATDAISHVVRGMDLFAYTAIHRLLQQLLDLPQPLYWHHPLLLDDSGEKLAKSRASKPLSELREAGESGAAIVAALRRGQLPLGITLSRP